MSVSSWFSKMTNVGFKLDDLETLLFMQLRDLLSAEEQLIDALPKMAEAASSPALKKAFQTHLEETRVQQTRLEEIFELLGQDPTSEECEAMAGLIAEGDEIIGMEGDPDVKDAALIAAAQRVEHYEMAGYGCAAAFASKLGKRKIAALLRTTLKEEANADKKLTDVAEKGINAEAARA
jgi:ferritin-like metal-binding protein YciE